jgi:O-antigen ligase
MKLKTLAHLLLFSVVIFFSEGGLFERGSVIPRIGLISLIAISVFYFMVTILSAFKETLLYKTWTLFLLLNVIGFFLTAEFNEEFSTGMFKNILIILLPFYPFYYLSKKNIINRQMLFLFLVVMIPVIILNFYNQQFETLLESNNSTGVNNAAYLFVALIPYVFFLKDKRFIAMLILILLVFFIILGSKRGAMITGFLGAVRYLYFLFKTIEKKHRVKGIIIAIGGLIVLGYFILSFFLNNEYLVMRLQSISEDGGSGRDVIFTDLWNAWANADSINTFFGFGFASSMRLNSMGLLAHNDWLEVLTSFGLIGLILYFLLFYSFIRGAFKLKEEPRFILRTIILMLFIISLVSMFYTIFDNLLYVILIAYIFGTPEFQKKHRSIGINATDVTLIT